jgi:hypothetical protein
MLALTLIHALCYMAPVEESGRLQIVIGLGIFFAPALADVENIHTCCTSGSDRVNARHRSDAPERRNQKCHHITEQNARGISY